MRAIVKATAQTGGAAIVLALFTVITTKVLATIVGTSGVGLYSVLTQAMTSVVAFATIAGGIAIVQGIASRDGQERDDYIATTSVVFLAGGLAATIALVVGAPWIAPLVLA